MASVVPAHNPLIFSQSLARPSPGPGALQQSFPATTTPWNAHHTSGLVSADQIQHGYVVRPTRYAIHLQPGDLLFLATTDAQKAPDSMDRPETIMNLFSANDALDKFFMAAKRIFDKAVEDSLHWLHPYVNQPEAAWTELYDSKDPKMHTNNEWVMIHYLTLDGIKRRMRYIGANIIQSARDGAASQRVGNYMANALFVGRGFLRNVWGDQAHSNSKLYVALMRKKKDEAFQWVPIVPPNYEEVIPPCVLRYIGVSGFVEDAHVEIIGASVDIQGDTPKNKEILARALGQSSATLEARRAGHNMLPWIEIAASNRVFQRFYY